MATRPDGQVESVPWFGRYPSSCTPNSPRSAWGRELLKPKPVGAWELSSCE